MRLANVSPDSSSEEAVGVGDGGRVTMFVAPARWSSWPP